MEIPIYIWFILGILFLISELIIPGFTIFFFGCGAILTAIASIAITPIGNSSIFQIILWLISSILSLVFFRKRFTSTFKGRLYKDQTDSFIGHEAVVVEDITAISPGRVLIGGTTWKAEALNEENLYKDEKVRIIRKKESESLTFIVSKNK